MKTGEREGDCVERVVPERAIETHEAYAEQFVWAVGITLVVGMLVLIQRSRIARTLSIATVAGTFAVAGLGARVGHAGGQLVYVHNAAAAYAQSDVRSAQVQASGTPEQQPETNGDQD
jgi:cell division protein FtsW (lipid II flippase)